MKILKLFILLTLFVGLAPLNVWAKGIGVSPALLQVVNMLPGNTITKNIVISRGNPVDDDIADITISGPAAKYISGEKQVVLPKGKQQFVYPVTINTEGLAEGTYKATITATLVNKEKFSSEQSEAAGSIITAGAQLNVEFSVSNEELQEFTIRDSFVPETEEGQQVAFTFSLSNTGNVAARPSRIEMTIIPQSDPNDVKKETIDGETIEPVAAFSDKEIRVLTKTLLPVGVYDVVLSFYNKDEQIFEKHNRLQVFPSGTLELHGDLKNFITDERTYRSGELVKFTGTFLNTSERGIASVLNVDIFKNGKRVDMIKAEPIYVPGGQEGTLETQYRVNGGGWYTAKGTVQFGPRKSNEKAAKFYVEIISTPLLVTLIVALVGFAAIFLWWRRKKTSVPVLESAQQKEIVPSSKGAEQAEGSSQIDSSTSSGEGLQGDQIKKN